MLARKLLYIVCESAVGKAAACALYRSADQDACSTAMHLREQNIDLEQAFELPHKSQFLPFHTNGVVWPFCVVGLKF